MIKLYNIGVSVSSIGSTSQWAFSEMTVYNPLPQGKGREQNWLKFVLVKTKPLIPLSSALREAALRTALSLRFVRESTMKSLRLSVKRSPRLHASVSIDNSAAAELCVFCECITASAEENCRSCLDIVSLIFEERQNILLLLSHFRRLSYAAKSYYSLPVYSFSNNRYAR